MRINRCVLSAFVIGISYLLAAPASACDEGTIKINQSKVNSGNITPGDARGFPVTISTSGSYCLTSNLDLPAANLSTSGIIVGSHLDVTINLNGFRIQGPYTCCAETPGGNGISSPDDSRAAVSNGFIAGMAGAGAYVGTGSVHDLQVAGSGQGITVQEGNVENVVVRGNRDWGLAVSYGNVSRAFASENAVNGIEVSFGSVRDSSSSRNGTDGIDIQEGTLIGSFMADNAQTVFGTDFRCNGHCAYSQNNFAGCVIDGPNDCVTGNATQVPASNVCNGTACP